MGSFSYRQVIRLSHVPELLLGACLSRIAERMFALAIILYALDRFNSPVLAGWASFASMGPGLIVSPIAGALLDRLRAPVAIIIDMFSSAVLVLLLALADRGRLFSAPLLLALVATYSLTSPLSSSGIRVLIPRLVPDHALEMANALDTASYAGIEVLGPALVGALFDLVGATVTMLTIAVLFAAGSLTLIPLLCKPQPRIARCSSGLLNEAAAGIVYVIRHPALRGLAASYSLYQAAWGILLVAVPVFVTHELGSGGAADFTVGLSWAVSGLAGGLGALLAGRLLAIGREREIIGIGVLATALAIYPLSAHLGLFGIACGLVLIGFLAGPIDVGVLTLRQRRTAPGWLGRVLAVSMSLNLSGLPLGSALAGWLVMHSIPLAFMLAALASIASAVFAFLLIPTRHLVPRDPDASETYTPE